MSDVCATCGDRVYRLDMARCDGCDKAPTFCDCLRARRAEQFRLIRSRATTAETASRDDRIDGEYGTGYVGEFR
jgi:hypothetical protein